MKHLINLKKLIIRTIGRIFANSQNTSDMLKKKLIFTFLLLSLYSYPIIAQTVNPSQVKEAQKALAEKGIPEDEVRKRLLAQGIDLDNIKPGQMAGLEDKIKAIVAQIEKEQGTSKENAPKEGAPVKEQKVSSAAKDTVMLNQKATSNDAKSSLDPMSDKLRQQEIADQAAEDALKKKGTELSKDISQRIKEGASLQEAIMDEINEKNGKLYSNSGNVFGHEIFFNKSLDLYRKTSTSTTPDSYILDVGDKLAINIFGVSQADLIYEIEEDGFIRPSNMLKVYLKGVPIGKAKELLKNRFRQAYMFADGQFNVDLHTARTVTVSIFGEVNIQGTYTISALNTALQALMAAGGPKETGGIRTIKIVSGSSEKLLDVYDFIANPNVQNKCAI
jgi:protein involved in polysaccharide export with SLBB domain